MIPRCHNRPPARGFWVKTKEQKMDLPRGLPRFRQVYRYVWPWFEDRCATWDGTGIGKTPETARYPQAHGWDCTGCRLLPEQFK